MTDGRAQRWSAGSALARSCLPKGGYDSDALRDSLAARRAAANIRPMPNRKNVPAFKPILYRQRNRIERYFSKLKHFRAVATRCDKRDDTFLASVKLASSRRMSR
jgi:transposase